MLDRVARFGYWVLLILSIDFSASVAQEVDPDWPCVQRLVPELTAAQMWSGPPLDQIAAYWQADAEIAPLVLDLVDVNVEEANIAEKLKVFISSVAEEDRSEKLPLLFKAVLESVNGERNDVIRVIKKYAAKQKQLSSRIAAANAKLKGIKLGKEPDEQQQEFQAIIETRDWDLRIFDDRYSMLTLICDQPVRLEQRAFALARAIQEKLP